MQLDRFDGNRAYSPDNCQWLAASVHSRKSRASHKSYCNCKMCLHPPKAIVEAILDKMKERRHDDVPF